VRTGSPKPITLYLNNHLQRTHQSKGDGYRRHATVPDLEAEISSAAMQLSGQVRYSVVERLGTAICSSIYYSSELHFQDPFLSVHHSGLVVEAKGVQSAARRGVDEVNQY